MTRYIHKIISVVIAMAIVMSLVLSCSVIALGDVTSGSCGDNIKWSLDSGVLTISGTGDMTDYTEFSLAPWYDLASKVQSVVVSSGVTSVGNMAFYGCTNLTTVKLADSVISLGSSAFSGCYLLVQIYMPGVEEIDRACFYDCKQLVNIELPSSLRNIGEKAFFNCRSLTGVTVPASVTSIGSSAFAYCTNLVYAKILGNIATLEYWTFYGCEVLWQLYLPKTVESVGTSAVSECPQLYFVDYGGKDEVRQELQKQLDEECLLESNSAYKNDVSYTETDGAIVSTVTQIPIRGNDFLPDQEYGTTINANIKDSSGWNDLVDEIIEVMASGEKPTVIVQVQDYDVIEQGALDRLADMDITLTIHTSDNVYFDVSFKDQTASSISGQQNLKVAIVRNEAGSFKKLLGDVVTYTAVLENSTYNTTVRFPLGLDVARQVATLYSIKGNKLTKLSSVIVDDEGMAAYNVAGIVSGKYLIALNVKDISSDEVSIPKTLAKDYGIDPEDSYLTDEHGNKYIVTGTSNKLGISLGTLTLIIVGVLVGSVIFVGGIMIMWNKQQKKKFKTRY